MNGLLPIGSVVLLHDGTKKVMIMGLCQKGENDAEKVWDYCGVVFPEGYMSADRIYLFNNSQIKQIFMLGYQDEEQLEFSKKINEFMEKLREE